jgi:hypothetical protein
MHKPYDIYAYIPIKLQSIANKREHWAARAKRNKSQGGLVAMILRGELGRTEMALPCVITLIRVSPRDLDQDNLIVAFKCVRDVVADLLIPGLQMGRADSDPRITWHYDQRKGKPKENAIEVKIRPRFDSNAQKGDT